jgi:competence protein ComEC
VIVTGEVRSPPDWYAPDLARKGVEMLLSARSVARSGEGRGGVTGLIDDLRVRAGSALGRSMPAREAALARGFVLGQDQQIDPVTVSDFQDSGLAHLLAVSGQNVVLLSLLCIGVMAIAGVGHWTRLFLLAALILLYVPLAGGGPSIQRAGVMGLAGLAALAASRPASRAFVLVLAVVVTLLINPRAAGDIGWQLSFVAVTGIAVLARPLGRRIAALLSAPGGGSQTRGTSLGAAMLDGVSVTIAASVTTAPLMAFHFDRVSVATVAANLAALPAVAPAMWLGMAAAGLGSVWSGLAVPPNLLNSILLAYIARVASWFGRPGWAVAELGIGSVQVLVGIYLALAVVLAAGLRLTRSLSAGPVAGSPDAGPGRIRVLAGAAFLIAALLLLIPDDGRRDLDPPARGEVRIDFLDIGQGDATLIRVPGSRAILVDGGPPGGGVEDALSSAGVERLAAVIATHADLDHVGGLYGVFETHDVDRYLFDGTPAALLNQASRSGTELRRIAEGRRIRVGPLSIEVLWPPARTAGFAPPEDRNLRSLVLLLEFRKHRILVTGDAEAEAVPVDPGPLDVLRVAHHGSDDAGLPALLDRTAPRLAVLSVGGDNRYGHPTAGTLSALSQSGSAVLRTDLDGTVSLILSRDGISVESGR